MFKNNVYYALIMYGSIAYMASVFSKTFSGYQPCQVNHKTQLPAQEKFIIFLINMLQ